MSRQRVILSEKVETGAVVQHSAVCNVMLLRTLVSREGQTSRSEWKDEHERQTMRSGS